MVIISGVNHQGFDRYGLDVNGYDKNGFNVYGVSRMGRIDKSGFFDEETGFSDCCFTRDGSLKFKFAICYFLSYLNIWHHFCFITRFYCVWSRSIWFFGNGVQPRWLQLLLQWATQFVLSPQGISKVTKFWSFDRLARQISNEYRMFISTKIAQPFIGLMYLG